MCKMNEIKIRSKEIETMFHQINRLHVKMNKKEKKKNTAIVLEVLKELIKIMRINDKLFDSLKPKLDFLGSYFDGLRVGHPTEYDINVILTFPVNYNNITLVSTSLVCDYTHVIMPSEFRRLLKQDETSKDSFYKTQLWCNKQYMLSTLKFRAWIHSVVDKALNTLSNNYGKRVLVVNKKSKYNIFKNVSGPAITMTIIKQDNTIIDVDLVPTLQFQLPQEPHDSKVCFDKVVETKINTYFVVPKPNQDEFSWRLTFPFQERWYLKNKNNLKSALRLLKHFRDVQGFTQLCSYFIKTLFLWECINNDDTYWTKNSLSSIVFSVLLKLRDCLAKKEMKNFWNPDHNIIEKIKPKTCDSWCNRLNYIINDIKYKHIKDPCIIYKFFSYPKATKY